MIDRRLIAIIALAALLPVSGALVRAEVFSYRDHGDYFVPMRLFTSESLRGGVIPLWNPYNGSGEPWLANPQTGVFYPPAWLFLVLPFEMAYSFFLAFHLGVLGIGSFLLFREFATRHAALFGAIAVMFSGPTLSLLDVSNNLASFAWIPLSLSLALSRQSGSRHRSMSAICLSLMFLAAEPFIAAIGAGAFAFVFLSREPRARVGNLALIGLQTIALAAVILLPFLELLLGSDRLEGLDRSLVFRNSMSFASWFGLLISADSIGPGAAALRMSQGFLPSIYLSIPICAFALIALVFASRKTDVRTSRALRWTVTVILGVGVVALGNRWSLTARLWDAALLGVTRYPARLVPFATFAIVFLAVIGFDQGISQSRSRRVAFAAISSAIGVLALSVLQPPGATLMVRLAHLLGSSSLAIAMMVFFDRLTDLRILGFALALLSADLLISARPMLATTPFVRTVEPFASLLDHGKVARVPTRKTENAGSALREGRRVWYSGYLNLLDRKFDLSSAAPVVDARYLKLHDVALRTPRVDLVDFLSVAHILADRELRHPQLIESSRINRVRIFENQGALPMVQLWSGYETVASDEAALTMLESEPRRDPRLLITDGAAPVKRVALKSASPPARPALRWKISTNEIEVDLDSSSELVVVVTQRVSPGWRLTIDGRDEIPLRANGLFLAARPGSGRHAIRWRYRPRSFAVGSLISTIGILFSALTITPLGRRIQRKMQTSLSSFSIA